MSEREPVQAASDRDMARDTGQALTLGMVRATDRAMAVAAASDQFPVAGSFGAVVRVQFQRAAGETPRRESAQRGRHAAATARWQLKPA